MNYKNREQYKHLMRVLAVAAIVLLECAVFSVFWTASGTDPMGAPCGWSRSGIREIRLSS